MKGSNGGFGEVTVRFGYLAAGCEIWRNIERNRKKSSRQGQLYNPKWQNLTPSATSGVSWKSTRLPAKGDVVPGLVIFLSC
jgi:hypothetical protein